MNNNDHKGNFFPGLIFGMMIGAGLLWFFTKTKEGQKMSERFKEKGIDKLENLGELIEDIEKKGMEFKPEIQLADFVSTLADLGLPTKKEKKVTSCPVCRLTYSEFKDTGRLGCSNCYEVFSSY